MGGENTESVSAIMRDALSRIGAASDMGDVAGRAGVGLFLGGLLWLGVAPFCAGLGAVLILVSVVKGVR